MNLVDHLTDPNLFGPWFKDPKTWQAWHVVLRALYGNSMSKAERTIFTALTGRQEPPRGAGSRGLVHSGAAWWQVLRDGAHSDLCGLFRELLRTP